MLVGAGLRADANTCPFTLVAFSQVMLKTHVGHPRLAEVVDFAEFAVDKLIGTVTEMKVRACEDCTLHCLNPPLLEP
jgi:hypothetical protein